MGLKIATHTELPWQSKVSIKLKGLQFTNEKSNLLRMAEPSKRRELKRKRLIFLSYEYKKGDFNSISVLQGYLDY